jgi:hypothetical protein
VTYSSVGDPATAAAADAEQAAYFRGYLHDQRELLLTEIAKRNAEIEKRGGNSSSTRRLRSQMRSVEAEVQHLDRLIWRLNCRFAPDGAQRT